MTQQAVLELPLDDDLLKVLASDTRREMLRLLTERRMTGSELATRLDLGKPAVAEHLKKLLDAGLIIRHDDEERHWVYYQLSPRGESLLQPSKVRFYFVLSVAAAALLLGVALTLAIYPMLSGPQGQGEPILMAGGAGDDAQAGAGVLDVASLVQAQPPLPESVLPKGVPPLPDPAPEPVAAEDPSQDPDAGDPGDEAAPVADGGNVSTQPEVALVWVVPENLTLPSDAQATGFYYSKDDVDVENGTVTVQVVYVANNTTIVAPVVLKPAPPGNATPGDGGQGAQAQALDADGDGIPDWMVPWLTAKSEPAPAGLKANGAGATGPTPSV